VGSAYVNPRVWTRAGAAAGPPLHRAPRPPTGAAAR
jgi:hypothetical protein